MDEPFLVFWKDAEGNHWEAQSDEALGFLRRSFADAPGYYLFAFKGFAFVLFSREIPWLSEGIAIDNRDVCYFAREVFTRDEAEWPESLRRIGGRKPWVPRCEPFAARRSDRSRKQGETMSENDSMSDLVPGGRVSVDVFFSWADNLHRHHSDLCRAVKATLAGGGSNAEARNSWIEQTRLRAARYADELNRAFRVGEALPNPINCFGADVLDRLLPALFDLSESCEALARLTRSPQDSLESLFDAIEKWKNANTVAHVAMTEAAEVLNLASVRRGWHQGKPSVPVEEAAPPVSPARPIDREQYALSCLLTIGPNATKIAKAVGVPRTTLLGWPKFRENYDRMKADAEARKVGRRRGRRAGGRDFEEVDG